MQLGQLNVHSRLSQQSEPYWAFKRSQLKESDIIAQTSCSRHQHCPVPAHPSPLPEEPSFEVDSALLHSMSAQNISTEPIHHFINSTEVDLLAQANIKKKKFQKLLQQQEKKAHNEHKSLMMSRLQEQAKQALIKSVKKPYQPKGKWGHSIFNEQKQPKSPRSQQKVEKGASKEKKKVEMKPINQRIAQYRRKEAAQKDRINQPNHSRQVRSKDERTQNIAQNAHKIMEDMKNERISRENNKKATQAKIRAIQIYSKEKVEKGRKNPLKPGEDDFDLGDSRYSTFSARANNRKMVAKKKGKSKKIQQNSADPSLAQTKKSNLPKPKSSKHITNKPTPKNRDKLQQNKKEEQLTVTQQLPKGPFYIWNMPINQEDVEKLEKEQEQKVFVGVDRFNYKNGKTFREQANELLAARAQARVAQDIEQRKQLTFDETVEQKKQQLLTQYSRETTPPAFTEHFWNEDQLFKESVFQNFHFHPK